MNNSEFGRNAQIVIITATAISFVLAILTIVVAVTLHFFGII